MSRALLVANGGGHMRQLHALASRIPEVRDAERVWVTFDESPSRSLVGDERLVAAYAPTTRNIKNLVRNYLLARRLLKEEHFDIAVSTGSALAVPFLTQASRRGIPCHYIESAARVEAPSLSGRMVARSGRVAMYTQHERWADETWAFRGSVFEGFVAVPRPDPLVRRVLVTLGSTDLRFDRLVNRLQTIIPESVEVHWQIGKTAPPPPRPGWESSTYLPAAAFRAEIAKADTVVTHSGTGTALTSLENGRMPVLVPRSGDAGEAVDNHQQELAGHLRDAALAVVADADEITFGDIEEAAKWVVEGRVAPDLLLRR